MARVDCDCSGWSLDDTAMTFGDVKVSADGLRQTKVHEWLIRFFFGGLVSLAAGIISQQLGPVVGGLFLAFPSILPATVTLVKKHKGRSDAAECSRGAAFGSFGLITFAIITALAAGVLGPVTTLSAATLGWLATALIVWRMASDS
jgi:hypothetical protein